MHTTAFNIVFTVWLVPPMAQDAPAPDAPGKLAIGVVLMDASNLRQVAQSTGLRIPGGEGAWIQEVIQGSPAAKAGLIPGDIIYEVESSTVRNVRDFGQWMTTAQKGRPYRLVVKRHTATGWGRKTVDVIPEEMSVAFPSRRATNGFRSLPWGASRADVQAKETARPIAMDGDVLGFSGTLADLDVVIGYSFADDKLVRGRYVVAEEHSTDNAFLEDFARLLDVLVKEYGKPAKTDEVWSRSLYKDEPESWGVAVAIGDLAIQQTWTLLDTDITLGISGDNYKINVVLDYASVALATLEARKTEERRREGF